MFTGGLLPDKHVFRRGWRPGRTPDISLEVCLRGSLSGERQSSVLVPARCGALPAGMMSGRGLVISDPK